jgi:hypothetical protein
MRGWSYAQDSAPFPGKVQIIGTCQESDCRCLKRLQMFKRKMRKTSIKGERASSVNNAFASALAVFSPFDEDAINEALKVVGQSPTGPLICVYCGGPATDADHLNGLVKATRYTGHGQVIGNLVPACAPCNNSKGNKPWREWAGSRGISADRIAKIAEYESLAPPAVSEEKLHERYPDLMAAYEKLRILCQDTFSAADHLAKEIQRLEKDRLDGQIADPNET